MSFLDKLLGRDKKATGDMTGDSSMAKEGAHKEQEAMASDSPEPAEQAAQKTTDDHAERSDGT